MSTRGTVRDRVSSFPRRCSDSTREGRRLGEPPETQRTTTPSRDGLSMRTRNARALDASWNCLRASLALSLALLLPSVALPAEFPPALELLPEGASQVRFHPKAPFVALIDSERRIRIWSTQPWSEKKVLEGTKDSLSLRFSPSGRWLAVRDSKQIQVWKAKDWTLETKINTQACGLAAATSAAFFTPDDEFMIVPASKDSVDALVYRTKDWSLTERLNAGRDTSSKQGNVWCFDMDPKGQWIIVGKLRLHFWAKKKKGWRLVGTEARQAMQQGFRPPMARFDPKGKAVATVSPTGVVKIRRRRDMKVVVSWRPQPQRGVYDLEYALDGKKIFTCAEDFRVFNATTGELLATLAFPKPASPCNGLRLSPDGKFLIAIGKDRPRVYAMEQVSAACR